YPHLRAGTLRAEQGTVARCAGGAAQAAGRAPVGVPTRCQSAALVVSVAGAGESTARTGAVPAAGHRIRVLTSPLPPARVVPAWVVPAWVVPAWVVPALSRGGSCLHTGAARAGRVPAGHGRPSRCGRCPRRRGVG